MFWRRFPSSRLFSRKARESDLERELRAHLELEAEQRGDAYAARRALGNEALIKEDVRRAWRWASFDGFASDFRQSVRMLRRRPSLTIVAILSLAAGTGANTAVFSLARGIVLKTLQAPGSARFVLLRQHNASFHIDNCCFTYSFFEEIRRTDPDFEEMLAVQPREVTLADSAQTEKTNLELVSGNYFRMLNVRPALGRLLDEADETSARVCVISYDLWQERFGSRADVIGKEVTLDREPFQIVGVAQRGFRGATLHSRADVQIPPWIADKWIGVGSGFAMLLARLKPGISRGEAEKRLDAIGKRIQKAHGPRIGPHDDFFLMDGSQGINSQKEQYGKPVLVLFLLVAVVLMVTCSNLAALLLARSVERSKEAGMRLAIGASRGALIRQFLTEGLLLAAAGGAGGWLLARVLSRVLLAMLDPDSAGVSRAVRLDGIVVVFCAGLTLLVGVLFGILPAWRAASVDPLTAVRGSAAGGGSRPWLSGWLMSGQLALSLALLFGAGLFTQTLRHLRAVDLGFDPENVVMLHIDDTNAGKAAPAFFQELLRRVRELPEVRSANITGFSALSGGMAAVSVQIPGYAPPTGDLTTTDIAGASDGYFRTMGIPLLAGRDFNADDTDGEDLPVIVNQQFVRQYFGGDALGRRFTFGGRLKAQVIGVVGTSRIRSVREDAQPVMYTPFTPKRFPGALYLQVRTPQKPALAISRLRALVHAVDSQVPIDRVTTMEIQIEQGLARERMLAFLSTLLGSISVLLAGIGLYGVLAFSVSRRTREIGIRMAVGADRRGILAMVLGESLWIICAGIGPGVPLALLCGRLASSLLYRLKAQDTATAIGATALLTIAALVASLVPAWRAARVDPMAALRSE